jgi:SAM-dependent methyltransferase
LPGHLGAAQALAAWPLGSAILEVGSGVRRVRDDVLNLEIDLFENVDIVANAARMPFLDETFDLVICDAVLEHVPNPQAIVSEIGRAARSTSRSRFFRDFTRTLTTTSDIRFRGCARCLPVSSPSATASRWVQAPRLPGCCASI